MASLGDIRRAIDNTVQRNIEGLRGFNDVQDVVQVPAMVVMPARDTADFNGAMGRGLDTWRFDLYLLVQRGEAGAAQAKLDAYVDGSGPKSVREIIFKNPDLGLSDGTDAQVEGVREYGGKFQTARVDHVGAIVRLTVRTPGR